MRPTKQSLLYTQQLITPFIHRTPLLQSQFLTKLIGCRDLLFKAENLQKIAAFKARGACNAILNTDSKVVCTNSSGNHGAAVALMASQNNRTAYIVMPENVAKVKQDAIKGFKGNIVFCGNSVKEREETTTHVSKSKGAYIIHPYNDWHVIAGQATAAMEIYHDLSDIDYLLVPIGGGGLCSGTLLATEHFSPHTKVIGVEPLLASDAKLSLQTGIIQPQMSPITIADGLRTNLGDKTFSVIQRGIHDIVTVDEEEIISATFLFWRTLKVFVEASSGTVLAALIKHRDKFQGKRVAAIISGGNVDLKALQQFSDKYDNCV